SATTQHPLSAPAADTLVETHPYGYSAVIVKIPSGAAHQSRIRGARYRIECLRRCRVGTDADPAGTTRGFRRTRVRHAGQFGLLHRGRPVGRLVVDSVPATQDRRVVPARPFPWL